MKLVLVIAALLLILPPQSLADSDAARATRDMYNDCKSSTRNINCMMFMVGVTNGILAGASGTIDDKTFQSCLFDMNADIMRLQFIKSIEANPSLLSKHLSFPILIAYGDYMESCGAPQ